LGEACSTHGRVDKYAKVMKSESKKLFGRLRRRWDDNIKIDLKENTMALEST
jgi:hypothetical protein